MYGRPDTVRAHQIRAHYRELIDGLHALRPKKRRSYASWIVLSGCVYFLGALGVDASVREAFFTPHVAARAPQFVADVRPAARPAQQLPTVVSMPALAVPAPQLAQPAAMQVAAPVEVAQPVAAAPQTVPTFAPVDVPPSDGPLARRTKRSHSRKHK